jgi:hypothetical protein
MSLKMKIIFIIFGVVLLLFIIQSLIAYVGSEKKRENFENKEDADETERGSSEQERKEPKETTEKKTSSDDAKKLRLSILESIEDVFSSKYPGSNQKSVMFDELLKMENFENIKRKEQKGQSVLDIVSGYVEEHMTDIKATEKKEGINIKDFYEEPPKSVKLSELYTAKEDIKSEEKEESGRSTSSKSEPVPETTPQVSRSKVTERFSNDMSSIQTQMEEILQKVNKLQSDITTLKSTPTSGPAPQPAPTSSSSSESQPSQSSQPASTSGTIIEGFEQRYMYAPF